MKQVVLATYVCSSSKMQKKKKEKRRKEGRDGGRKGGRKGGREEGRRKKKKAGLPRTYTAWKELGVAQKGVIKRADSGLPGILKIPCFRESGK